MRGEVVLAQGFAVFGVLVKPGLHPLHHLGDFEAGRFGGEAWVCEVVEGGERRAVVKLWGGFKHGRLAVGRAVGDREHAAGYAAELVGDCGEVLRGG